MTETSTPFDDLFTKKKAELIPFHALNEFMRNDYRLLVVRTVLTRLDELDEEHQKEINRLTKKLVKVQGFRHSDKAPAAVRIQPTAEAFEKQPNLVAAVLDAWSDLHSELRQQVFELLEGRGWTVLPVEAERKKLPGFFIKWPKDEDFQKVNDAFQEKFPGSGSNTDDVSLMIVWVSMRLPYLQEETSSEAVNSEQ